MIKLRKNKKGEDMLLDFWAIVIFVFILIIFFILFLVDKRGDAPATVDFEDKDVTFMLNSFIRAPYAEDDTKTIGEIIAEDSMTNDFTRTEKIFKSFFSGVDKYKNNPIFGYVIEINKDSSAVYQKGWIIDGKVFIQTLIEMGETNLAKYQMSGFVPIGLISPAIENKNARLIISEVIIPRSDMQEINIKLGVAYYIDKNNAFK